MVGFNLRKGFDIILIIRNHGLYIQVLKMRPFNGKKTVHC